MVTAGSQDCNLGRRTKWHALQAAAVVETRGPRWVRSQSRPVSARFPAVSRWTPNEACFEELHVRDSNALHQLKALLR